MAILHKNISAEGDIHNPKWFSGANNGDVAWRNELGVLESTDELVLPAALNFVDGSAAPPTSNSGDIYVLSSGASVNAGWGTVALGDWVRYDGTTWNDITPQKSNICYNETLDKLFSYDGSLWTGLGGDSVYTASSTAFPDVEVTIDNTFSFLGGGLKVYGLGTAGTSVYSIWNGDGTPNKLWDFLDNGNINLGVDSVLNIGVNDLDVDGSGLFKASNGTRSIGVTSWNTHTYWGLNNGVKTWSLISANSSGAYNQDEFSIGVTGFQPAFRAFEDSVGVGGLSKTNFDTSFSLHAGTNGIKSSGSIVAEEGIGGANKIELDFNNYPKVKITNGTTEYWLVEGDGTGSTFASGELYLYDATNARKLIHFLADGNIDFPNLPTSAPTKGMWNDGGALKIA